jgi:superfamily I DNA and/or RNA helicase
MLGDNPGALQALHSGQVNVLGGTAWLWARPEFANAVDVLFVDEAGQMSLANVLAVSRAAKNIVLLGDPQQLEQPQKGSHPEGANASVLQHILGASQTILPERGIFLPVTWRLAPSICSFTSELFYESRLTPKVGLERQCLIGTGLFDGSGLWVLDVDHDGNRTSSIEEVDVVADLVARLTAAGAKWVDEDGDAEQLTVDDILVVSPYNAQVSRLAERLECIGVRVGTVDKFQGQEAPVVIYSMATSRPEDAPRGMEFLYSHNRLNVASSRARCAAILVASPRLFEPECRTPRQMKLANALCRYREFALSRPMLNFGAQTVELRHPPR